MSDCGGFLKGREEREDLPCPSPPKDLLLDHLLIIPTRKDMEI